MDGIVSTEFTFLLSKGSATLRRDDSEHRGVEVEVREEELEDRRIEQRVKSCSQLKSIRFLRKQCALTP